MQGLSWCVCLGGVFMAKEWAKGFYNSKRWLKARDSYIKSVYGLCEICGDAGFIVHHTIELTPENIDDPEISLCHDNFEYLCLPCHNQTHGSGTTPPGIRFDDEGNLVKVEHP